jgi:hypothetical protein
VGRSGENRCVEEMLAPRRARWCCYWVGQRGGGPDRALAQSELRILEPVQWIAICGRVPMVLSPVCVPVVRQAGGVLAGSWKADAHRSAPFRLTELKDGRLTPFGSSLSRGGSAVGVMF